MTNPTTTSAPNELCKKLFEGSLFVEKVSLGRLFPQLARDCRVWGALALAVLVSCQSAPITHRPQLMIMDGKTELALGNEVYRDMISQATVVKDARLNRLMVTVGRRVAAATGREDMDWEFTLVDTEAPNAYCLPGGKVVINSGILPIAQNEAGLAAVMAHEAGHAIARHGAERGSHARVRDLGVELVDMGLGHTLAEKTKLRLAWGVDFVISLALPFSRTHELEADEMGLIYMARAGYDPREAMEFWKRMAEYGQGEKRPMLDFLSTHPTDKTRLWKIQLLIPRAMKEYDKTVKLGMGEDIL
ncbi:MAG: M48 family metallopeptidase [Nitrospinota bacterium]|nr:M48 family metallopeptidase [Nitrospinota bacterium]